MPIAPYDRAFADFYPNNGILSVGTQTCTIRDVKMKNVANSRLLVSATKGATIEQVHVIR